MNQHPPSLEELHEIRADLSEWFGIERREYADKKFDPEADFFQRLHLDIKDYGLKGGEMEVFLGNYRRRAELLGLDTMQGRQAFAKYIVTCMATLEHAIHVHGPMPKPGAPSGEVDPWPTSTAT